MPLWLVMTRSVPVLATATKTPLPYVTARHSMMAAGVRVVQVMPSGPERRDRDEDAVAVSHTPPAVVGGARASRPGDTPKAATATKRPLPYVTARHSLLAAAVRIVQVIPTRFVPVLATATKVPLPYVTPRHSMLAAAVRDVQTPV